MVYENFKWTVGGKFSYKVYSSLDKMAYNMPVHNNLPENWALIKYTPPI